MHQWPVAARAYAGGALAAACAIVAASALDGIAAAHREIDALYDIAQTIASGLTVDGDRS